MIGNNAESSPADPCCPCTLAPAVLVTYVTWALLLQRYHHQGLCGLKHTPELKATSKQNESFGYGKRARSETFASEI